MTPEQWLRVRAVLAEALELKAEDRPAFLDRACASDDALRREVDSLLASSEEARTSFLQSSALQTALTPGARLGDYEVERLLGSGGMGEVYRARDTRLGRGVAIKVLPSYLSRDSDRLRRFEQEARAAAALNHPNILAVFQLGTHEGAPYLVTELLEGGTLREQLARGPLPLRKAIDCGVQTARGLAAAHEKGIAHRDLKPENLFVTKDGRVKILDFGLAKLTQRQPGLKSSVSTQGMGTEPGVVMGTVGYMSPEQVRGEAADHRADIFAFGAILYEMLAGKRAFQKPTSAETMSAILREDPAALGQLAPGVPLALQRVAQRCLEKNPEQRFQSASDLAFALEALSDSGISSASAAAPVSSGRFPLWSVGASLLIVLVLAAAAVMWLRRPLAPPGRPEWVQLTNLPDSVSQPALSPDGRMLTFVRGPSTFMGPGQIYVKMLPDGEPVELTHDNLNKMSPVFSPDGAEIAYTTVAGNRWDTWAVPLLGGQPHLWLPNASGLVWTGKGRILFSEVKDNDIHMGIVAAEESRAGERDVYVPASGRGMAHRSSLSPDGKWVLVVEMNRGRWLPCRLVPRDGSSPGRQVGPADAGCTSVAWSPDGRWMYLNSSVGGAFHIWRESFPEGQPEQVTSGPSEEEGIVMAADGHSFISAVGRKGSSVWVHDAGGDRQVSLEGFSYDPKFTPDGKTLCYRILKGASVATDPSEVRIVDLVSGRNEPLLPGFNVVGIPGRAYDISPDSREVIVQSPDPEGKMRLWLAPLDRSSPPRQISGVLGEQPLFGPNGEIFFRGSERNPDFVYRVRDDGMGLRKATDQPIVGISGISPDGQWLLGKVSGTITMAFPLRGDSPVQVSAHGAPIVVDSAVRWSPDGRRIFIPVPTFGGPSMSSAPAYLIPLPQGKVLPPIPPGGFQSREDIAKLPGARLIDELQVTPGTVPEVYAFVRETVQRNLYRIPLQ